MPKFYKRKYREELLKGEDNFQAGAKIIYLNEPDLTSPVVICSEDHANQVLRKQKQWIEVIDNDDGAEVV